MEFNTKFIALGNLIENRKFKEAAVLLSENKRELFMADAIRTLNYHFYVLIELGKYDECFAELEIYKSYPYQKMEVEEHLEFLTINLPNMIKKAMEAKTLERNLDGNGVDFTKFHSRNERDLETFILQIARTDSFEDYENELDSILKRNVSDHINFLCLSLLYEINSSKLVDFKYKNGTYSCKLSDLHFPFSGDDVEYHKIKYILNTSLKDVSVAKIGIELLGFLRLSIFPEHLDKDDVPYIVEALINTAKKMFGQQFVLIENERVKFFMNLLDEISNS